MSRFKGWKAVVGMMLDIAENNESKWLNPGQRASVRAVSERIPKNGVIIADEVGMGKTRIAVALTRCVIQCGGRVSVIIPPGLGYQWRSEMKEGGVETPELLRSLWGYLEAWSASDEIDWKPWFNESVVFISHAFTNWRMGDHSAAWRLALVPELIACWRKETYNRMPRGYYQCEDLYDDRVKNAAWSIAKYSSARDELAKSMMEEFCQNVPWNIDSLFDGSKYARGEDLRPWLEKAVGIGLGSFDLVIIDEAHKSRAESSGLSRILNDVLLKKKKKCRHFAMTATPVELNVSQWDSMLERIGVDENRIEKIKKGAIEPYMASVAQLKRSWRSDPAIRDNFIECAKLYQEKLSPFLLRRDKREEPSIASFREKNHGSDYRRKKEIVIEPNELTSVWKEVIFVAEALSVVTRQAEDPVAKRLRLTIGNGHGINALIDEPLMEPDLDCYGEKENDKKELSMLNQKRLARAEWWKNRLIKLLADSGDLYRHPAILKAIEVIEREIKLGEKVLVFGRFTRPLQALTRLLNARAMLRCLEKGDYWPQSRVSGRNEPQGEQHEWKALQAAHQQLNSRLELDSIERHLEEQYRKLENERARFRNALPKLLSEGVKSNKNINNFKVSQVTLKFVERIENKGEHISSIARGLSEYLGEDIGKDRTSPSKILNAFDNFVHDMLDEEDFVWENDNDVTLKKSEPIFPWDKFIFRINDEYDRQRGNFARLMNGQTPMSTRRFLQSAFNRQQSPTKVLVAQSLVGREGLNLHRACRVVLLLHPEWNPGVVEQQIGRVDRVGSRWETQFNKMDKQINHDGLGSPSSWPYIEVMPIMFKGTYDEHNWNVLNQRWDDLRSQLHGDVITDFIADDDEEGQQIWKEISKSAPTFSPL